jgi:hypothetical protein
LELHEFFQTSPVLLRDPEFASVFQRNKLPFAYSHGGHGQSPLRRLCDHQPSFSLGAVWRKAIRHCDAAAAFRFGIILGSLEIIRHLRRAGK